MVVVYLKNGEKAPMPDANYVKLEAMPDGRGLVLRILEGGQEAGQFKWDEVAGYTIDLPQAPGLSSPQSYEAWGVRQP
jgi:hypothetical protein